MRHHHCALALALCASPALAQEAIFTPAATQPAKDKVYVRQQFKYLDYGHDPTGLDRDIQDFASITNIAIGVTGELSFSATIPLIYRETDSPAGDDDQFGIGDMTLLGKWRFWKEDLGPIDTARASIVAGLGVPSYDDDFSSDGWNPIIGAVFTTVLGRHGFNASASWMFTTDSERYPVSPGQSLADLLQYDLAYLFRLAPAEYTSETRGAWYLTAELNGDYETNGDNQILFSPGILYEGITFAAELGVQLPVYQDLDHRPESDWAITFGLRFLF